MEDKDRANQFGATAATTIRLTEPYNDTGNWVIADSLFRSLKTATELLNRGLYSIMLIKTAHKGFPKGLLSQQQLQRGEWETCSMEVDGKTFHACRFRDLKLKEFISTCSTVLPRNP